MYSVIPLLPVAGLAAVSTINAWLAISCVSVAVNDVKERLKALWVLTVADKSTHSTCEMVAVLVFRSTCVLLVYAVPE